MFCLLILRFLFSNLLLLLLCRVDDPVDGQRGGMGSRLNWLGAIAGRLLRKDPWLLPRILAELLAYYQTDTPGSGLV
jgi:hypothetical protein